ncbi:unnamed protein product (macronuclear) [Paramecium tetraurelia]|uniref:C2H2-type domain-containing protein n=1 Tax=Paramecium tetraurelia TaxID=5888 RepID=A0CJE2_PARTE|nr:uncharacterized protein GSPATT00000620001 [Paramecium tetraurelia]CAK70909.1 unnamed protein product [Paramecium tetraurelia]|eukprot:XP_001438306.1 hypothetical protein (macronuclear) [Paramecium tetraurelia strain d4-2]
MNFSDKLKQPDPQTWELLQLYYKLFNYLEQCPDSPKRNQERTNQENQSNLQNTPSMLFLSPSEDQLSNPTQKQKHQWSKKVEGKGTKKGNVIIEDSNQGTRVYVCGMCGEEFEKSQQLGKHYQDMNKLLKIKDQNISNIHKIKHDKMCLTEEFDIQNSCYSQDEGTIQRDIQNFCNSQDEGIYQREDQSMFLNLQDQ